MILDFMETLDGGRKISLTRSQLASQLSRSKFFFNLEALVEVVERRQQTTKRKNESDRQTLA